MRFLDALDRRAAALDAPPGLPDRAAALDALERWLPDTADDGPAPAGATWRRALAWRARLQAANEALFAAIRAHVLEGAGRAALWPVIEICRKGQTAPRGDGYDALDELVGGVLQMPEPGKPLLEQATDMVFYQPTPARHIVDLIERAGPGADDVLVDLGSGLGLVPLLASIVSPARCIGVEREPAYVASARACARALRLERAAFVVADAREADLSRGTVFYLYTPFRGAVLRVVLDALRAQAAQRPLRVCGYGPCVRDLAAEPWLHADAAPDPQRVTIFRART